MYYFKKDDKMSYKYNVTFDEEKVKEAVNATGYQVLSVKSEPYEKKGFSLFHKK